MVRGIAIIGLNGSGKSTLNHLLARELGYFEMDVEDYYFPQQKAHRQWALDHAQVLETEQQPYTAEQDQAQVEAALLRDMDAHPQFILSCVKMNWCQALLERIDLAFWVQAPLGIRMERIRSREEKRFGARALPGGDMCEQQEAFRELVARRDPASVEQSAANLRCPVIPLDGTRPLAENVAKMLAALNQFL